MEAEKRVEVLLEKLAALQSRQQQMNAELNMLKHELWQLQASLLQQSPNEPQVDAAQVKIADTTEVLQLEERFKQQKAEPQQKVRLQKGVFSEKAEEFIGTNLISKVGILITIIGVFIGAKYAIDKELISATMRIVSGYVAGIALSLTALKLKKNYEYFSAILMGGGLAILYFITYIAFSFYQLYPQWLTFIFMLLITGLAVTVALWYNQKVIAILGQVAAYAIPFLLSDGSGRVLILFSYISIINIGLLILSLRKNWKILYRLAFVSTWCIYVFWYISQQPKAGQFISNLVFLTINFLTFYATFIAYKLLKKELYNIGEIGVLLANALIYFFVAAALIDDHSSGRHTLAIFTIANAAVHLFTALILYRLRLADRTVYQFLVGLGFLFLTIAIPIELNGSWVTLLWALEGGILFYIGYANNRKIYLNLAMPMLIVASFSLVQDWFEFYDAGKYLTKLQPFTHFVFWSSVIVCAILGATCWLHFKNDKTGKKRAYGFYNRLLPLIFITFLYFTVAFEVQYAYDRAPGFSSYTPALSLNYLKQLTWTGLLLFYLGLLLFINCRIIRSATAHTFLTFVAVIAIAVFLTNGLYTIGNLRDEYILIKSRGESAPGWMVSVRYLCMLSLALLFFNWRHSLKNGVANQRNSNIITVVFNFTLLTLICNEFIHWMDMAGYQNQYKLGLTIICGLYAMALIILGITWRNKKLRAGAIVLFTLTLLKLFFYDLSALSTLSKTLVLVILGVILLVVSFLYNKYKHIITGDEDGSTKEGGW